MGRKRRSRSKPVMDAWNLKYLNPFHSFSFCLSLSIVAPEEDTNNTTTALGRQISDKMDIFSPRLGPWPSHKFPFNLPDTDE